MTKKVKKVKCQSCGKEVPEKSFVKEHAVCAQCVYDNLWVENRILMGPAFTFIFSACIANGMTPEKAFKKAMEAASYLDQKISENQDQKSKICSQYEVSRKQEMFAGLFGY